jgi:hypothetical protein
MIDMIKVRISKDGITRSYHLESKTAEWFNENGEFKGTFDIENELQGLAEIVNSNVGCTIDMIEEEKEIKIDLSDMTYERAVKGAEKFYNSVSKNETKTNLKEIPINELAIHRIAKELEKKLDKE